jgi:hypothetical protein
MAEADVGAVVALELELLTPAARRSRPRLEELLDPDFAEIGASGRLWSRAAMITALTEVEDDVRDPVPVLEVTGRLVGPGLVLVTYLSDPAGRAARRSSLWRRSGASWRLLHHQGTLLPVNPAGSPRSDPV